MRRFTSLAVDPIHPKVRRPNRLLPISNSPENPSPSGAMRFPAYSLRHFVKFMFKSISPVALVAKVSPLTPTKLLLDPSNLKWVEEEHCLPFQTVGPFKVITSMFGRGIAVDAQGWIFMIRGACVGETVLAKVDTVIHGCVAATILESMDPVSTEPKEIPKCKHFRECHGCDFQHVPYETEKLAKAEYVANFLESRERLGLDQEFLKELKSTPVAGFNQLYGYQREFGAVVPLLPPGQVLEHMSLDRSPPFHQIMKDVRRCELVTEPINDAFSAFRKKWIGKENVSQFTVYRQVVRLRQSISPPEGVPLRNWIRQQKKKDLESQLSINRSLFDSVKVDTEVDLEVIHKPGQTQALPLAVQHGSTTIIEKLGGFYCLVPPYSTTMPMDRANILGDTLVGLIDSVREQLNLSLSSLLVPMCGYGLLTMQLQRLFQHVLGFDFRHDLAAISRQNAYLNDLHSLSYVQLEPKQIGDISNLADSVQMDPNDTIVVLQPFKDGMDKLYMDNLVAFGPKVLIYTSINLDSQIYDIEYLTHPQSRPVIYSEKKKSLAPYSKLSEEEILALRAKRKAQHEANRALLRPPRIPRVPTIPIVPQVESTPTASYSIHSVKVLDAAPRTRATTTVFTLIRNDQ